MKHIQDISRPRIKLVVGLSFDRDVKAKMETPIIHDQSILHVKNLGLLSFCPCAWSVFKKKLLDIKKFLNFDFRWKRKIQCDPHRKTKLCKIGHPTRKCQTWACFKRQGPALCTFSFDGIKCQGRRTINNLLR